MFTRKRASVTFVLVTLGLDALGVGIIAPIVPGLVRQLAHLSPERAAPWVGALIAAYAAVQFFAAPFLGELSDRFGRRPVILASVFGLGCDYVLLALAPNLWWLFAGRLVAEPTSANVPAATAYIADVSAREDRPRLYGLVGATFGAGFVLGPAIGGGLAALGLRAPFVAAACLSFANVCFGLFILPESLSHDHRREMSWGRSNPFKVLFGLRRDRSLARLAVAWSCSWIGMGAIQSSLVLFTGYRFGWGPQLNGFVLAGVGLSQAVVEGFLLKHATRGSASEARHWSATSAAWPVTPCWRSALRAGPWFLPCPDRPWRARHAVGPRAGIRQGRGRQPGRDAGHPVRGGRLDGGRRPAPRRGVVLRLHAPCVRDVPRRTVRICRRSGAGRLPAHGKPTDGEA